MQRLDDLKGELNQAYRGTSKGASGTSTLLHGDDLTGRIKDMNESNRVANKLGAVRPSGSSSFNARERGFFRHQLCAAGNWMGPLRGAFRPNSGNPFARKTINVHQQARDASVEADVGGAQHRQRPAELIVDDRYKNSK